MESVQGCWAVVTGAGSGIGRAVACALAREGCNIFAADIDALKLHECREDILRHSNVQVMLYEIDLARMDAAEDLFDACCDAGIDVCVLVNDAGMFMYNDIIDSEIQRIDSVLMLHVRTVTALCRLFGGRMAANRKGWILNMASYSVWMPLPGISLYSASKSYIKTFSCAFAHEMRPYGVVVTAVSPAGVATDFYGLSRRMQHLGKRIGILMSPDKIARISLKALFRARRHVIPGWYHRLFIPVIGILPYRTIRFVHRKTAHFRC